MQVAGRTQKDSTDFEYYYDCIKMPLKKSETAAMHVMVQRMTLPGIEEHFFPAIRSLDDALDVLEDADQKVVVDEAKQVDDHKHTSSNFAKEYKQKCGELELKELSALGTGSIPQTRGQFNGNTLNICMME